jgi:hypothetical protein
MAHPGDDGSVKMLSTCHQLADLGRWVTHDKKSWAVHLNRENGCRGMSLSWSSSGLTCCRSVPLFTRLSEILSLLRLAVSIIFQYITKLQVQAPFRRKASSERHFTIELGIKIHRHKFRVQSLQTRLVSIWVKGLKAEKGIKRDLFT